MAWAVPMNSQQGGALQWKKTTLELEGLGSVLEKQLFFVFVVLTMCFTVLSHLQALVGLKQTLVLPPAADCLVWCEHSNCTQCNYSAILLGVSVRARTTALILPK